MMNWHIRDDAYASVQHSPTNDSKLLLRQICGLGFHWLRMNWSPPPMISAGGFQETLSGKSDDDPTLFCWDMQITSRLHQSFSARLANAKVKSSKVLPYKGGNCRVGMVFKLKYDRNFSNNTSIRGPTLWQISTFVRNLNSFYCTFTLNTTVKCNVPLTEWAGGFQGSRSPLFIKLPYELASRCAGLPRPGLGPEWKPIAQGWFGVAAACRPKRPWEEQ